jgi:nitrogen PTS system EIIA component
MMFHSKQKQEKVQMPLFISNYLSSHLVIFLKTAERDAALLEMINRLDRERRLKSKNQFYQAILEREKIVSTGIGMGVALPHAKLAGYEDFFIAIGISAKGIPWDSLDHVPVRLIFLIGGPDDKQTEYLQLLSRLTLAIKDEERRRKILQMSDPEDIIALFKGI